jgi:hypothetical protein
VKILLFVSVLAVLSCVAVLIVVVAMQRKNGKGDPRD